MSRSLYEVYVKFLLLLLLLILWVALVVHGWIDLFGLVRFHGNTTMNDGCLILVLFPEGRIEDQIRHELSHRCTGYRPRSKQSSSRFGMKNVLVLRRRGGVVVVVDQITRSDNDPFRVGVGGGV